MVSVGIRYIIPGNMEQSVTVNLWSFVIRAWSVRFTIFYYAWKYCELPNRAEMNGYLHLASTGSLIFREVALQTVIQQLFPLLCWLICSSLPHVISVFALFILIPPPPKQTLKSLSSACWAWISKTVWKGQAEMFNLLPWRKDVCCPSP